MAPYMPVRTAIAADTFKEEEMWHWARIVVIAIGILLLILGVIRGRELLVVGEVPAEDLGRVVSFTVLPLVIGLGLIVWGFVSSAFRR
jgi:hypothetical protein